MKKIHLPFVSSTNAYLKENYKNLENYTFVSADEQSEGRGRLNRVWKSENGTNLLFSLLILDKTLINSFKAISMISAYSVIEVLNELGLKDASIKWPNDVYVGDKKIAGILLEAVSKSEIECLIVGVGLNVNQIEFSGEYLHSPTSIKNELNKDINLEELKEIVYKKFIDNFNKLKNGYDFIKDIRKVNYLKDKTVYALIQDEKKEVKVLDINLDYSLVTKYKEQILNLSSDEVTFHF